MKIEITRIHFSSDVFSAIALRSLFYLLELNVVFVAVVGRCYNYFCVLFRLGLLK